MKFIVAIYFFKLKLLLNGCLSEFIDVVTQVLEVQLPGKKVVNAAAFWNGLRGQKLKKL